MASHFKAFPEKEISFIWTQKISVSVSVSSAWVDEFEFNRQDHPFSDSNVVAIRTSRAVFFAVRQKA
jgi:hypothetical protein